MNQDKELGVGKTYLLSKKREISSLFLTFVFS